MNIERKNRVQREELLVDESVFAVQNGLIGIRGNFAEGYGQDDYKQTLINGFFNYYPYHYEENSPSFPQMGQRIINVLDGQTIEFYIDNQPINKTTCKLTELTRKFDLEQGITFRTATYKTDSNIEFIITEERFASFDQLELFAMKISISSPNYSGKIKVVSKLQLPLESKEERSDSRINVPTEQQINICDKRMDEFGVYLNVETTSSNLNLGVGMSHSSDFTYYFTSNGFVGSKEIDLNEGNAYELQKFVVYTPSSIHKRVLKANQNILKFIDDNGYEFYKELQYKHLTQFWHKTNLRIIGDHSLNEMVQYNLFQLYASANDNPNYSIPAKGLTGEGYEGHYFWDTEIYMLPFFTITNPSLAKNLLLYRYHHMSEARTEALKQGYHKGVKIPWRTINGQEASPYFLAGSAQYHINSDVAYAVIKYYEFTNDIDFMIHYGFELLLETARFLYAAGHFNNDQFHIFNVTGPDEYTVLINDNYYTNSMAKYQFNFIVNFYHSHKDNLLELIQKVKLDTDEIKQFKLAADKMYIRFDQTQGIFAQDDSFLQKPEWDFHSLPDTQFPLLLHFHPSYIYRHQVLKQADVLLSMFLLDYQDSEILENNFNYYIKRTTHDSSLSKCIHSIIAFRLGYIDIGFSFLLDILGMDLENKNKNTHHGLHIANSGGIYLVLLYGIIGLRIQEDCLLIRPHLPEEMKGISTQINYRGIDIGITLGKTIDIRVSQPITLGIYNEIIQVTDEYHCDYR